jgi:deoxyribodipyrimidine photo-lyase
MSSNGWSGSPSRSGPGSTILVVYSSTDLRIRDHYPLSLACAEAKETGASVAAVFCYDVRTLAQPSLVGGFFRASPKRAEFLTATVENLRWNLNQYSDGRVPLFIRVGFPEDEIPKLCQQLNIVKCYAMTQYAPHERDVQMAMTRNLELVEPHHPKLTLSWGSTMVHKDDLAVSVEDMTREQFAPFFDIFQKSPIKPTAPFDCSDGRMKTLPPVPELVSSPDPQPNPPPELGDLPTLAELGYGDVPIESNALGDHARVHAGESHCLTQFRTALEVPDTWSSILRFERDHESWDLRQDLLMKHGLFISPHVAVGAISARTAREMMRDFAEDYMGNRIHANPLVAMDVRWAKRDFWHFMGLRYGRSLFFPYGPRPIYTEDVADYRQDLFIIQKWCHGLTGYPLADAGMKELTTTGLAHDRTRRAMAWLLTRGLGQDWRIGAEWFERNSLDYDPFICWGNFATQAGLVKDRLGEPVFPLHYLAARHDQSGLYVKRWLPQLTRIPHIYVHRPHVMTDKMQGMHGIKIGRTYPLPIQLWEGASEKYPKPPTYFAEGDGADNGSQSQSIEKLTGVGEAPRFGTALLPKALLPFTAESRERELVMAAKRSVSGKGLLRSLLL